MPYSRNPPPRHYCRPFLVLITPLQTGNMALHLAGQHGNVNVIRMLLDHGANKDAMSDGGWTPLMWAANNGKTEAVEAFVAAGADHSITATLGLYPGKTARDMAIANGHTTIAGCSNPMAARVGAVAAAAAS